MISLGNEMINVAGQVYLSRVSGGPGDVSAGSLMQAVFCELTSIAVSSAFMMKH